MKVIIQKPDLDTCLTGLIAGVQRSDNIVVSKGEASEQDIADPDVVCIEAGGSGLAHLNNFDHHNTAVYFPPACRQAYTQKSITDEKLRRLVEYVCMIEENIGQHPFVPFPSLSNIFSGMLFVETHLISQFIKGMEIFQKVLDDGIDPFSTMPDIEEWRAYKSAKEENKKKLKEILQHTTFHTSAKGLKIGFTESNVIGGIGFLYFQGCDVVIMYNPTFGDPAIRKYTVSGNHIPVIHLKEVFETMEKGWGGRETIIGSPRTGTMLEKEKVLETVIRHL